MKKISLIVLIISFAYVSMAQIRLGLGVSSVVSWMKGTDVVEDEGLKIGYSYGLIFENYFAENYVFASGVFITTTSNSIIYTGDGKFMEANIFTTTQPGFNDSVPEGSTGLYTIRHFEVPITLKLKTNEIGYITYFGQFGITPGIDIKSVGEFKVPYPVKDFEFQMNKVNPLNISLTIGGGIEYSIGGNTSLITGINFYNGFMKVTKDEEKVIMNHFKLRLGILF